MRFIKAIGLAGMALLGFAASAQATVLASPATSVYTSTIKAESEGPLVFTGPSGKVECSSSIGGEVESHGVSVTTTVRVTELTFTGCSSGAKVSVLSKGTLVFHTDSGTPDGNGIVTSTGAKFTVETESGVSCGFETSETSLGTLTGSRKTGGTATIDIVGTTIPREFDSATCGTTWSLSGSYKVTAPDYLDVDAVTVPSETQITSPAGTVFVGTMKAESAGEISITGPLGITIQCSSTFEASMGNIGSAVTTKGEFTSMALVNCTNGYTVNILSKGTLEIHTKASGTSNGNGTVTLTGTEWTMITPLGFNCIYKTSGTDLGQLTGSKNTGGRATLDISGASIPRTGHNAFCGSSGEMKGDYVVSAPTYLDVD